MRGKHVWRQKGFDEGDMLVFDRHMLRIPESTTWAAIKAL